jgi:hypothetical protein
VTKQEAQLEGINHNYKIAKEHLTTIKEHRKKTSLSLVNKRFQMLSKFTS